MTKNLKKPDPADFGLKSFADLLSSRPQVPGEEYGSFEALRAGIISSLAPITPYECVIAESLVAIEWELIQRRRMRELSLTKRIRDQAMSIAIIRAKSAHDAAVDEARDRHWEAFIEGGGEEDDWEDPHPFDKLAEEARISSILDDTASNDPKLRGEAFQALRDLRVSLDDFMAKVYAEGYGDAPTHDAKVQELERRRREVMRDYAALQKARPIDHAQTDADIEDAEVVQP